MARVWNRLNSKAVAAATKKGRYADGGGLFLSVSGDGRRRWVFRFTLAGRRRDMGLGTPQSIPLARARELAAEARRELAEGRDPFLLRRGDDAPVETFGEAADKLIVAMMPAWRNPKHRAQWAMTLKVYASQLRAKPVSAIDTTDVLSALQPIWVAKPETASRLRGRIERVLDAAKARGQRSGENPARWRGHLDQVLPPRRKLSRGHFAALPYQDIPDFLEALRSRKSTAAIALEIAILTATRSGEVLGARWDEISTERALWIIPASRMKGHREHRVPLSARAVEILRTRKGLSETYVFPGQKRGRPLSAMSMQMVLRRMNVDATPHGFRSSFRDWAAETTHPPNEVCEMALAHVVGDKTEAAYRRGDMFERRRQLMEAWCSFCMRTHLSENVYAFEAPNVA